jgi:hypothetical protein
MNPLYNLRAKTCTNYINHFPERRYVYPGDPRERNVASLSKTFDVHAVQLTYICCIILKLVLAVIKLARRASEGHYRMT